MSRSHHFDENTLYVTSGVARPDQLEKCLKEAISLVQSEIQLLGENKDEDSYNSYEDSYNSYEENYDDYGHNNNDGTFGGNCGLSPSLEIDPSFRVNLILDRNGKLFGYGYIRVASPAIYWMLLGRNPNGSERFNEFKDPNWVPPLPGNEPNFNYSDYKLSWAEMIEEEEKYIHPYIKETLEPLMKLPGYNYDNEQYEHLRQMEIENDKDPNNVPKMGYFELSRAYVKNPDSNKCAHKLCSRHVPNWIPDVEFKRIFKFYTTDPDKKANNKKNNRDNTYPIITSVNSKTQGRIVFVMFDPSEKDASLALLMTRKISITHPKDPTKTCTLIFDHAYENLDNLNKETPNRNRKEDRKDRNNEDGINRNNNEDRKNKNSEDRINRNNEKNQNNRNRTEKNQNNRNRTEENKKNQNNKKENTKKKISNNWNTVDSKKKGKTRDIW